MVDSAIKKKSAKQNMADHKGAFIEAILGQVMVFRFGGRDPVVCGGLTDRGQIGYEAHELLCHAEGRTNAA
jgi:hypothetical protein